MWCGQPRATARVILAMLEAYINLEERLPLISILSLDLPEVSPRTPDILGAEEVRMGVDAVMADVAKVPLAIGLLGVVGIVMIVKNLPDRSISF